MGLFSKIKKGLKKIGHVISKTFKKVMKPVKKFLSTKFGQWAMLALSIYSMGASAGMWSTPWSSAAGAGAATTTTAVPQVATATELAAQGAATIGQAAPAAAQAGMLPTAAEIASQGAATIGQAAPAAAQAGMLPTAAEIAAQGAGQTITQAPGLLSQIGSGLKSAGGFIAENPQVALMGGQLLQSAFAADPVEEQLRLEEERRKASQFYGIKGSGEGTARGGWTQRNAPGLVGAGGGTRYG